MNYQEEQEKLAQHRRLLIFGRIEADTEEYCCRHLRLMNLESPEKPIVLMINSTGGAVGPSLAIYDAIQFVTAPVYGLVVGEAASMACVILQACTKRFLLPHSTLLVHGISGTIRYIDILNDRKNLVAVIRKEMNKISHIYEKRCGLTKEQITTFFEKDTSHDAAQSIKLILADEIILSEDELLAKIQVST